MFRIDHCTALFQVGRQAGDRQVHFAMIKFQVGMLVSLHFVVVVRDLDKSQAGFSEAASQQAHAIELQPLNVTRQFRILNGLHACLIRSENAQHQNSRFRSTGCASHGFPR